MYKQNFFSAESIQQRNWDVGRVLINEPFCKMKICSVITVLIKGGWSCNNGLKLLTVRLSVQFSKQKKIVVCTL